jgi:hypothetical protein
MFDNDKIKKQLKQIVRNNDSIYLDEILNTIIKENNDKIIDAIYLAFDHLLKRIVTYGATSFYVEHLKIFIKHKCDINHELIKRNKVAIEMFNPSSLQLLKDYGYYETLENLNNALLNIKNHCIKHNYIAPKIAKTIEILEQWKRDAKLI